MKKYKFGFSVAEIMISLVVLGIIAMIILPATFDNSTAKLNIAAANKSKAVVAQAAMMVQTKYPKWGRGVTDANLVNEFKKYLQNVNGISYDVAYVKEDGKDPIVTISVSVDGDATTDVRFIAKKDGTIEEQDGCNIAGYKGQTNDCD